MRPIRMVAALVAAAAFVHSSPAEAQAIGVIPVTATVVAISAPLANLREVAGLAADWKAGRAVVPRRTLLSLIELRSSGAKRAGTLNPTAIVTVQYLEN
jgi:hypothetical protein